MSYIYCGKDEKIHLEIRNFSERQLFSSNVFVFQKYIDQAAVLAKKFEEELRIWKENNEKDSAKKNLKERTQ